jgi:hypothetical protein
MSNTSNISSAYIAGGEIGKCLIPAIIAGLFIYFQLKKKFENENKMKFPLVLVILMSIALVAGIITKSLEYKNKRFIEEHYTEFLNSNSASDSYTGKEQNLNKLNFNGLSFFYPDDWKTRFFHYEW